MTAKKPMNLNDAAIPQAFECGNWSNVTSVPQITRWPHWPQVKPAAVFGISISDNFVKAGDAKYASPASSYSWDRQDDSVH
jgi:hypothetical protein